MTAHLLSLTEALLETVSHLNSVDASGQRLAQNEVQRALEGVVREFQKIRRQTAVTYRTIQDGQRRSVNIVNPMMTLRDGKTRRTLSSRVVGSRQAKAMVRALPKEKTATPTQLSNNRIQAALHELLTGEPDPTRCVVFQASLRDCVIKDEPSINNRCYWRCPRLTGHYVACSSVLAMIFFPLPLLLPVYGPFAVLSFTHLWPVVFGTTGNASHTALRGNGSGVVFNNSSSVVASPLELSATHVPGVAEITCLALWYLLCYSLTVGYAYTIVFQTQPSMLRLLWKQCKVDILLMNGSS